MTASSGKMINIYIYIVIIIIIANNDDITMIHGILGGGVKGWILIYCLTFQNCQILHRTVVVASFLYSAIVPLHPHIVVSEREQV